MGMPLLGQQTLTIYQQMVKNNQACNTNSSCSGTILPLPYASVNTRSIGQSNHTLSVTLTNAPAQTCMGGSVDVGMEYSFDGTTFTRFGDQLSSISINADGQYTALANAYGAFPYTRIKIRSFDTTNCLITAAYSGVVAGQATISVTGANVSVINTPDVHVTGSLIYRQANATIYDSGIVTVPNSTTVLTASDTIVSAIYCNNKSGGAATLTLTNGSNVEYISAFPIQATAFGSLFQIPSPGMKLTGGIKWSSNTASAINCQVVGYQ